MRTKKCRAIESVIRKFEKQTSAPIGVAFWDFESETGVSCNGDTIFPIASVFKIFELIELFRMAERGELSLSEKIEFTPQCISAGSGILKELTPGFSLSIADYCYLMMAYSDNSATDMLLERIGLETMQTDLLVRFGFSRTQIDLSCSRLVTDSYRETNSMGELLPTGEASRRNGLYFRCAAEKSNQSSPNELLRCLQLLYGNAFLREESTQRVLSIMKKCALNQRIPARLPAQIAEAHKTGSLDRVANDAGIVLTPKGVYALVLFYNGNLADEEEYLRNDRRLWADDLLARLSEKIYRCYMEQ